MPIYFLDNAFSFFKKLGGSLLSILKENLVLYSTGGTVPLGNSTYLTGSPGNSTVPQVKGVSVAFDGTGYGTLTDAVTGATTSIMLPAGDWDEPINFWFTSGTFATYKIFMAGPTSGVDEILVQLFYGGVVRVVIYVGTVATVIATTGRYDDDLPHNVAMDSQDGICTLTVDTEVVTASCAFDGNQKIGFIGQKADGTNKFSGSMWGLSGPGFNLNMACGTDDIHPTVELSALVGGPNCTWSSFAAGIYEEHSDGSGFDLNVLGWSERTTDAEMAIADSWVSGIDTGSYITEEDGLIHIVSSSGGYGGAFAPMELRVGKTYTLTLNFISSDADKQIRIGTAIAVTEFSYFDIFKGDGLTSFPVGLSEFTFTVTGDRSYIVISGRDDVDDTYVSDVSVKEVLIGRQPAGYNGITDYPGPIAASMKTVGIPCLLGDGTGYVALGSDIVLSGDFTGVEHKFIPTSLSLQVLHGSASGTDFLRYADLPQLYINGVVQYYSTLSISLNTVNIISMSRVGADITLTLNGISQTITCATNDIVINRLGVKQVSAGLFLHKHISSRFPNNFYPCEAGTGTILEDTISGNNGVLTSFAGDPWSTRDVGRCLMCEMGFSVDRVVGDELVGVWTPGDAESIVTGTGADITVENGDAGSAYVNGIATVIGNTYVISGEVDSLNTRILAGGVDTGATVSGSFSYTITATTIGDLTLSNGDNNILGDVVAWSNLTFKQALPGISVCNTDGLHQDGSQPTYPRNTMENVRNAPVLHEGALGPLTQGVTALTGETTVDLTTLPFNTGDQLFVCDNGFALYSEVQSAANIIEIGNTLCT